MRRLQEIFWPHKNQAFRRMIGWAVFAFSTPFLCQWAGWSLFWLIIPISAYFAIIWYVKFSRDQSIATQAVARRVEEPADWQLPAAQQTSPGSERMFVPPPLHEG